MSIQLKQFFYWGVGAIAIVALAGSEPDLATILVIILIAGVTLTHWQEYVGFLKPPATQK